MQMRKFLDLPLERKLTLIVVSTMAAGMLLASLAIIAYQILTFTRFMIAELETTAEILGQNGTAALRFQANKDAERTLASLRAKSHISGACFFTPDEEIFAVYKRDPEIEPQPSFPLSEGYAINSKHLTWVKHIYQDDDFIGTVHIESDIGVLYEQVLRSVLVVLLITIACASFALLLGFKFLHTVSDPINHLIDTANRVSRERDYSLRARQYADDDLGILTREFNEMLEEIQNRDTEMELRVAERTEELSQANDKLQTSLQEKVVLLKEIHHRVKNNLQVISSLLSLQSRDIADDRDLALFINSQNRIKTMALIHERLYQSDDLAKVDFADYIPALADSLFNTYKTSAQEIALKVNVGDLMLDLDQAIPCGLMLNELISNSLKYAFPNERSGEIHVQLGPTQDGHVELVVGDNGIGLPADLNFRTSKSLGLQLINILTRQLRGSVELQTQQAGTEFRVRFPLRSESSPSSNLV